MNDPVLKLIHKINEKMSEFAGTGSKITSVERYFLLDLGTRKVLLHISNGVLKEEHILSHEPDIVITTSEAELDGLLTGKVNPMESYSSGRVKIKSSFMDKLLFAELLT